MHARVRPFPALAAALLGLAAGCGGSAADRSERADPARPYAGLQERPIRALPPERVADLLAGRGAGYALAAELNHYPGPTHVLDLAEQLALTSEQERATAEIKAEMQREARQLGRRLVDLEIALDRAFRRGTAGTARVAALTRDIAEVEGQLRNVHLQAHVRLRDVLTAEQVARYDRLRGYSPRRSRARREHEGGQHGHERHSGS